MTPHQDITFRQLRHSGHGVLRISCSDQRCSHEVVIDTDCWPESLRLSHLEGLFVCQVCGHRGAEVRLGGEEPPRMPPFEPE